MIYKPIHTEINRCFDVDIDIISWKDLSEEILNNFNNINLHIVEISDIDMEKLIESNGRKLILTRPKTREYIRKELLSRLAINKILKTRGYSDYYYTEDCSFEEVENLIEECTQILVKKQKELI